MEDIYKLLSSLRSRLMLLVFIAILPALALAIYHHIDERKHVAVDAEVEALQLVRLATKQQENLIEAGQQLLVVLTQLPVLRQGDWAACNTFLASLLKDYSYYTNLGIVSPDGDLVCSALPLRTPINLAGEEWLQDAVKTGNFIVGQAVNDPITGKVVQPLVYPALDEAGRVQYLVLAAIDLAWLNQLAAEVHLPEGSVIALLDRRGTILTRYPDPGLWVGQTFPDKAIIEAILSKGVEGAAETVGVDDVERLYAFKPLVSEGEDNRQYISIGIPTKVVYAETNRMLAVNLAGLGLTILVAMAVSWRLGNVFIMRRLNSLVVVTQRLASGDLKTRTEISNGKDELNLLAQAFNQMAATLEQRQAESKHAEERYYHLFDKMMNGFALFETLSDENGIPNDYRFLDVNPAFEKITGLRAEQIIGKTVGETLTGLESYVIKTYDEPLKIGNSVHFEIYDEKQERTFDVYAYSPQEGQFATLLMDITESKRAEKQLHENAIRLQALAEISRAIAAASLDDQTIMDDVTRRVAEMFGDACILALTSEDGDWLLPVAYHHPDPETLNVLHSFLASTPLRLGEGMPDYVLKTGQPLLVEEVRQDQISSTPQPEYRCYPECYRVHSVLIVPLRFKGRIIGTLGVTRDQQGKPYTKDDQIFLQEIGDRTASAIINARIFEQEQARSQELAALNSLSSVLRKALTTGEMLPIIIREVHQLLRTDSAMVILRTQRGDQLKVVLADGHVAPNTGLVFPSDQGLSGIVFCSRQPYVTDDYAAEPDRLLNLYYSEKIGPTVFVPLQSELEMLGVLMAARHRSEGVQPFSASEVRLLVTIGEMLGNSLRRAWLFEEANRRLSRVQALRKIDLAITGVLDLRISIDIILEQVMAQTGVDAACVLLLNSYNQTLKFAGGQGFRTDALQYTNLRVGEGYAGRAALEQRILHIPDLRIPGTDLTKPPKFGAEGFVAYYAIPLIAKGQVNGVLEIFHRSPLNPDQEWLDFMETLAGQAAIAIDNATLFSNLQRSHLDLILAYDATIEGWTHALDLRDKETEGHTQRVTVMTLRLAQAMGMTEAELAHLRRGALLHDIGKMGVPDHILLKPGSLTEEEWLLMRKHPEYAYEMLSPIVFLKPALDIPYYHHEKWDGTGYPHQLKGEQIPLAARIFAIIDVWDALTSDRPYRSAWPEEKAIEYIQEQCGKHFDPHVVEVFLQLHANGGLQMDYKP